MSKNLKDFAQMKFEEAPKDAPRNSQTELPKDFQNFYDSHKNLSQNELQEELIKEVAKQKMAGTFDFEKLSNTFNMMAPYMSEEQKNHINSILQGLK